jgi:sugar phosphate isomerase/epimerase
MARLKRGSTVLETARERLAGLKSITPKPNFGPTLDLDQYEQEINNFNSTLDQYNATLTLLDTLQNDLGPKEANLREKNKRMLAATGALYGPDSNEYEIAGGTRASERKRPAKKKPGNP